MRNTKKDLYESLLIVEVFFCGSYGEAAQRGTIEAVPSLGHGGVNRFIAELLSAFFLRRFRIFLITVFAAVDLILFIREIEDMRKLLLDGGDASGIPALDDSGDLLGKNEASLFYDSGILYYIDGDVVVYKGENVKVKGVDVALYL